jgi:hypothetical protein
MTADGHDNLDGREALGLADSGATAVRPAGASSQAGRATLPDLDSIEAYAKSGGDIELLALVAEARAAREENQELKEAAAAMATLATRREVELRAARPMRELLINIATDEILTDYQINRARDLLAAYDKVTGGVS